MRIVSIGDLVTDFYYKEGKLVGVNGGMSSHNIIANLSNLKIATAVYGVCGNDEAGEIAKKSLEKLGVNTDGVVVKESLSTRCFHVSYYEENGKLEFTSKKRCPYCQQKKWYSDSEIDPEYVLNKIDPEDVLVFDNLNIQNQKIIDSTSNQKMLDLGQYFELENYTNEEILTKIASKFTLINLNERVAKYLLKRFAITQIKELNDLLQARLLIVTQGKKGAIFSFAGQEIVKKLETVSVEVDATGAGDAFFSVFIAEYLKNNYEINENYINHSFALATKLTQKVVAKFGARGHLQTLFKVKNVADFCSCNHFLVSERKQVKRCNININYLEARVLNALNSPAYDKLRELDFSSYHNSIYVGTGGSYAAAFFAARLINQMYGTNTLALYPRDLYYRNLEQVDKVFLFSYSGTTNDLIKGASLVARENKLIITKGDVSKVSKETEIPKDNILSYLTKNSQSRERGFLSFEGAVAPAALFLKHYFAYYQKSEFQDFIQGCFSYWNEFFKEYFVEKKQELKEIFKPGNTINIFGGDFTTTAVLDLESKLTESGVLNVIVHEKKNFSHGRFINYEHQNNICSVYLQQKTISKYEEKLLTYLENGRNIIIASRYEGILSEFDLLVASQYFIYYISNLLGGDLSKPAYSEEAMKLYFYKGDL